MDKYTESKPKRSLRRNIFNVVYVLLLIYFLTMLYSVIVKRNTPSPSQKRISEHRAATNTKLTNGMVAGSNQFAVDMYRQLSTGRENITFSPYSISVAMAMVHSGAKGDTREQIAKVMHFDIPEAELQEAIEYQNSRLNTGDKSNGTNHKGVSTANSIWLGDINLVPEYKDKIVDVFKAKLETVDYCNPVRVACKINSWVSGETLGKIQNVVSENDFNEFSVMTLVNCIALDLPWEGASSFPEHRTKEMPFFPLYETDTSRSESRGAPVERIEVPMMNRVGDYLVAVHDDFTVLDMPMESENGVSLVVIPPNYYGCLPAIESMISQDMIHSIRANMKEVEVILSIPRFNIDTHTYMNATLNDMGITDAFTSNADFSGIGTSNGIPIKIDRVIHAATTEIKEKGVSSSATTVVINVTEGDGGFSEPPDQIIFEADHPFMFLIQDTGTGAVLFMGRVVDPTNC